MSAPYHATTWPLLVPAFTHELLRFMDRDQGTTATSTDDEMVAAMQAAGHAPDSEATRKVLTSHGVRRYEALTGHPF